MRSPLLVLAVMGVSRGNPPETAGPRHWVYCVLFDFERTVFIYGKAIREPDRPAQPPAPAQPPGQLPDTGALLRSHAAVLPLFGQPLRPGAPGNIAPKHLIAYILYLQESGKAPSTIKTDLAAIRFYHDIMSAPRYTLPDNGELCLQQRTILGVDRTWSVQEFEAMLRLAAELGREDYVTILMLGWYEGLRIHECFRIDTATAAQALREQAITIKGKGGLVRTIPLHPILEPRFRHHLEQTPRGGKLFVPDGVPTHQAIKALQAFIYLHRPYAQEPDSTRPMTFHGLRHTCAARWYDAHIQAGDSPYAARKAVAELLGHGRDDVTKIYLASRSAGQEGGAR